MAADDRVDWRDMREFAGVDLTKSFILSWQIDGETLLIDVDMFLTSDHPFYERPRPAEKICIRPTVIEFPYCESIRTDSSAGAETLNDIVERIGPGAIEGLQQRNERSFEINGAFGTVKIDAERPILRFGGS